MKRLILSLLLMVAFLTACGEDENTAPVVDELIIPETVEPGSTVQFQVIAHDADGDTLTYTWLVDETSLDDTGQLVSWTAPDTVVTVTVKVHISDGINDTVIWRQTVGVGQSTSKSPLNALPDFIKVDFRIDISREHTVVGNDFLEEFHFHTHGSNIRIVWGDVPNPEHEYDIPQMYIVDSQLKPFLRMRDSGRIEECLIPGTKDTRRGSGGGHNNLEATSTRKNVVLPLPSAPYRLKVQFVEMKEIGLTDEGRIIRQTISDRFYFLEPEQSTGKMGYIEASAIFKN